MSPDTPTGYMNCTLVAAWARAPRSTAALATAAVPPTMKARRETPDAIWPNVDLFDMATPSERRENDGS
ncbi:hypothetical protein GCM10007301_07590 [Azorhizobium oxalatiphilum]|uniref:Uncharacterized protein n=1 Tax=Azorhizobium oxalatiphilum TaxID=980631 RepID=A0A917BMI1_9HYPH|nr:hypothetical protein GCM10007301_07590 [Azorhizobium oxalatiphilum]